MYVNIMHTYIYISISNVYIYTYMYTYHIHVYICVICKVYIINSISPEAAKKRQDLLQRPGSRALRPGPGAVAARLGPWTRGLEIRDA